MLLRAALCLARHIRIWAHVKQTLTASGWRSTLNAMRLAHLAGHTSARQCVRWIVVYLIQTSFRAILRCFLRVAIGIRIKQPTVRRAGAHTIQQRTSVRMEPAQPPPSLPPHPRRQPQHLLFERRQDFQPFRTGVHARPLCFTPTRLPRTQEAFFSILAIGMLKIGIN